MIRRPAPSHLPPDTITVTTYGELDQYLGKFAAGQLDLVLLIGRPGTGKSEGVKRFLRCRDGATAPADGEPDAGGALYVEGHARPFGLYRQLWDSRGLPVVLDDLDRLYSDADCIRLLKPLCNGGRAKRVSWLTNLTLNSTELPSSFTTSSNVLLIANEWRSLNANVKALEDRAIILHFDPSNEEVHRRVREWFSDADVYSFVEAYLPYIPVVSMRHYEKAQQLRRAGLTDWKASLLKMMLPDRGMAVVAALQIEHGFANEKDRVRRFTEVTGMSRPTYYRLKGRLAATSR